LENCRPFSLYFRPDNTVSIAYRDGSTKRPPEEPNDSNTILSPPRLMLVKDVWFIHSCGDRPKEAFSALSDQTDKRVVVIPRRYVCDLSWDDLLVGGQVCGRSLSKSELELGRLSGCEVGDS